MVAIRFNVREGKRLFSIVGAGDIPAKILSYFSASILVLEVGTINLLWVSIIFFMGVYLLLRSRRHQAVEATDDMMSGSAASSHAAPVHTHPVKKVIGHYFHNSLIFSIALWFLISYCVMLIIDYTFLAEIKVFEASRRQLASFIALFFGFGRILAVLFELLFSSRLVARLGLTNALLIPPVLLFLLNIYVLTSGEAFLKYLYVFGGMVLVAEALRYTLQEPVVLVLFQPLDPHARLRGHAIAKGYTLPVALFLVGLFLEIYLRLQGELFVDTASWLILVLMVAWAGSVFLIRKVYHTTLVSVLQKGFFTGTRLFLQNPAVNEMLVEKAGSSKPQEVIHSLNLLERSGYNDIYRLLLKNLKCPRPEVKEYVLTRIIENNMVGALPLVKEQLENLTEPTLKPLLIKTQYFLEKNNGGIKDLQHLEPEYRKEAMIGLMLHKEQVEPWVIQELTRMAQGDTSEKLIALNIIAELGDKAYEHLVAALLQDTQPKIYSRAIEVAGRSKYFSLFKQVTEVAEKTGAYRSLHRTMLFYGDPIYKEEYIMKGDLPEPLVNLLCKTAGMAKGLNSTLFLESALKRYPAKTQQIVEALWEKKAIISIGSKDILNTWVNRKLDQSELKMEYYLNLAQDGAAILLQEALYSEIHQDIQTILKALALYYDQPRIERVIELYKQGYKYKLSNAVEMLELLIPDKHFKDLDKLIEFTQDVKHKQLSRGPSEDISESEIVKDILQRNNAGCSAWTKAVACYLIPRLQDIDFPLEVLRETDGKEDHLFSETKNYVLSMLS
ncbi:hypothetical protein [Pontibacter ruber]|uniref:HEAT repeat protein n=1 Tax=Pontibacter ruber TaxID=1343895 RepID=A0ABW5D0C1_9BACT|nr:hypothetical protein [Pontibacter ruber]